MSKYTRQVMHKRCGGAIILATVNGETMHFLCKECHERWFPAVGQMTMPSAFRVIHMKDSVTVNNRKYEI